MALAQCRGGAPRPRWFITATAAVSPIQLDRLHPDARRPPRPRLSGIGRRRLRRHGRELRRLLQDRADRRPRLAHPQPARARDRRIPRLCLSRRRSASATSNTSILRTATLTRMRQRGVRGGCSSPRSISRSRAGSAASRPGSAGEDRDPARAGRLDGQPASRRSRPSGSRNENGTGSSPNDQRVQQRRSKEREHPAQSRSAAARVFGMGACDIWAEGVAERKPRWLSLADSAGADVQDSAVRAFSRAASSCAPLRSAACAAVRLSCPIHPASAPRLSIRSAVSRWPPCAAHTNDMRRPSPLERWAPVEACGAPAISASQRLQCCSYRRLPSVLGRGVGDARSRRGAGVLRDAALHSRQSRAASATDRCVSVLLAVPGGRLGGAT
jgi:hypothetical protein